MFQRMLLLLQVGVLLLPSLVFSQTNFDYVKAGFSLKVQMNNVGSMGRVAYAPWSPTPNAPVADSLGLEFPAGARVEHLYGGGVWIGGQLDTSTSGPPTHLKRVSVAYEGWLGPYFEFFPGTSPADTFWRASKGDSVAPPGWDAYWGPDVPFNPISDQDLYCTYTDTGRVVSGHIPMKLKVIQRSFSWTDPYAEGIVIIEYRVINVGSHVIDSAYVGFFFDADVGPIDATMFEQRNFTGYYEDSRTAYIHNPIDEGSTPVGVTLLWPQDALRTLRYTFQWFPGPETPANDEGKYNLMASGDVKPDEFPDMSDTRFVFAFGPFSFVPGDDDTIAIAVISGFSRTRDSRLIMQQNASRALDIYLNQGITLPPTPPSPPLRMNVGFRRVSLDWKWRPGDDSLYRRPDPELNWDSTNQVARRYPDRITNPPPGYDSTKGGRNFEAYRIWRSEDPTLPLPPDASFTLLRQLDTPTDSFEYNTGLEYTFSDSNLVRGKVYTYAVTSKSIPNLATQTIQVGDSTFTVEVAVQPLESSKLVNAARIELPFSVSTQLDRVAVVPNPYRTDRDYTTESGGYEGLFGAWDENKRLIKFINLPEVCTIRIFSLSGDLVRTVQHDGRSTTGISRGDVNVPLVSESNRALASGIYIFTVESNLGVQTGKFVIIR